MIRPCDKEDVEQIWTTINDGAQAYKGVIPEDRWTDPYMTLAELRAQIADGVRFWAYQDSEAALTGVMGIQFVQGVTLIRHAYVRQSWQGRGIGTLLLAHLRTLARGPVLIGAWADATWALRFYQKHGFQAVDPDEKVRLLRRYWKVSERQIETSVVLADSLLPA